MLIDALSPLMRSRPLLERRPGHDDVGVVVLHLTLEGSEAAPLAHVAIDHERCLALLELMGSYCRFSSTGSGGSSALLMTCMMASIVEG